MYIGKSNFKRPLINAIGDIQSLFPPATNVLALTATAQDTTRETVIEALEMKLTANQTS